MGGIAPNLIKLALSLLSALWLPWGGLEPLREHQHEGHHYDGRREPAVEAQLGAHAVAQAPPEREFAGHLKVHQQRRFPQLSICLYLARLTLTIPLPSFHLR